MYDSLWGSHIIIYFVKTYYTILPLSNKPTMVHHNLIFSTRGHTECLVMPYRRLRVAPFFLFEINGPILSRLTTGKKKSLNMCPCADKANSTRDMDRCVWWSRKRKRTVGGNPSAEGRLMVHILYLKGNLRSYSLEWMQIGTNTPE